MHRGKWGQNIKLPARSPNLNACAERWVRSVREEWLGQIIVLSERHLRYVLKQYAEYFMKRRPHQGLKRQVPDRSGEFPTNGSLIFAPAESSVVKELERLETACHRNLHRLPFRIGFFTSRKQRLQSHFCEVIDWRGIQDALGAPARLCHRNSQSRTAVASRIAMTPSMLPIAGVSAASSEPRNRPVPSARRQSL